MNIIAMDKKGVAVNSTVLPTFDGLFRPLLQALRQLGGSGSIDGIFAKTVEVAGLSERVP